MFTKGVCDVGLLLFLYSGFRLKIVDDDVDWQQMVKEEEAVEEEEDEAPVVSLLVNHELCARSDVSCRFLNLTVLPPLFCQCFTKLK